MGRDVQVLKLEIQNDTVTVVYSTGAHTISPLH